MSFDPGRIYYEMLYIFDQHYTPDNKVVICNEGSSRSSKTFDTFHFLYTFCDHNRNEGHDIYILRDTLKHSREHTFRDFKKFMKIIEVYPTYLSENSSPQLDLFGNKIYFRGLDDHDVEGYPSSIVFFNESLEMDKYSIEGISMRCEMMEIYDWNPKYTQHWCFDLEGNPNAFFTHSTYKDNFHLKKSVVQKIESYCPWEFEDFHLHEDDRRPNAANIKNLTADKYRWKVYGEGIRAAPEGLIFQYVNYIDHWPEDVAYINSMDFGFTTDPHAMGKVGETKTDIYVELLCYQPIERPEDIDSFADKIGMNKKLPTVADSADKYTGENKGTVEMVKALRLLGWSINKVHKTKSVMFWLLSMKGKTINIVINHLVHHARKEQENYRMKVINGIAINQPEDKFNHFWDMCFSGDTLITTDKGLKQIKDIKHGDKVLTTNGYKNVINKLHNGLKTIRRYTLYFDTFILYLHCTSNHKIKTNKGWIEIAKLKKGIEIYLIKDLMEENIIYTTGRGIIREEIKDYILKYGNGTTVKYLKDTIFIIKMEILKIIISLILVLLKPICIIEWRLKKDIGKIQLRLKNFSRQVSRRQKVGINQMKVENGIPRIVKKHGLIENIKNIFVKFVAKNMNQDIRGLQNTAIIIAKLKHFEEGESWISNVYDLHINDTHEYFANGVLVHNCRYGHMALNQSKGIRSRKE